ncbi:MAG: hypothetical protein MK086_09305 [Flavobacteriales bacterium]|nr:hypothetical protein [Flavobacteriales bacterium]
MKTTIVFLALFVSSVASFAGGGWTYKKGKGFVKISQTAIYGDQLFNPDGEVIDIRTIGYYATSAYAEYGISDKITAIAYAPFFTRNTLNAIEFIQTKEEIPGDELNSFGDIDLSIQYGFYQSDTWVASVRVLFGLPTGKVNGGETGILQSGDGEFNQMIRFDLSRPISDKSWISFYAGFNNRTNDFSDEYRLGGEYGTRLGSSFYTILKLDVVQSFFNGEADASQGGTIFSNDTEFISPAIELAYELDNQIGFSFSAGGAFAARNILAAPNLAVGVYKKF